ncbi:MAG: tetratricopeptide repeat protein, partial [Pseudomonadota bacterium]
MKDWETHMNAAQAAIDAGNDIDAEKELTAAVKAAEKADPDSPQMGMSLNSLAALYDAYGEYDAALPLYEHALRIMEAAYGPDSPEAASLLNGIAELYRATERVAEAIPLFERAIGIQEKALGEDNVDLAATINNLAIV